MGKDRGFISFDDFDDEPDPAVQSLLNAGKERAADRKLDSKARKRKRKEREKTAARLAKGVRKTYDLPPELANLVAELAARYDTTESQVAKLLLTYGLAAERAGALEVDPFLERSTSRAISWVIALGEPLLDNFPDFPRRAED